MNPLPGLQAAMADCKAAPRPTQLRCWYVPTFRALVIWPDPCNDIIVEAASEQRLLFRSLVFFGITIVAALSLH